MENNVYLLYSGNAWMNTSSLQLLAVCSSENNAIDLAKKHARDSEQPLDVDDEYELEINNQTYGRDENYLICECEMDQLD